MRYKFIVSASLLSIVIFALSCTSTPDDDSAGEADLPSVTAEVPQANIFDPSNEYFYFDDGMMFIQADLPTVHVPPDIGVITADERDALALASAVQRQELSRSFQIAYIEGLLRGLPLAGVLGGDFVHSWPFDNPSAWAQNWHSAAEDTQDNLWGIPSLILAVRSSSAQAQTDSGGVYIVQGKLLDQYGKSGGINGANGIFGYGAPLGNEFLLDGKLAQRFEFGVIAVDSALRGAFSPEQPPSFRLSPPDASPGSAPPGDVGIFANAPPHRTAEDIQAVFTAAWRMTADRGIPPMTADAPGEYLALPADTSAFIGTAAVRGVYIQTFNGRTALLALPDSPALPPTARFIAAPFLRTLLSLSPGDDFSRSLTIAFSRIGVPLTDPLPLVSKQDDLPLWREAQRFSRGWLVRP